MENVLHEGFTRTAFGARWKAIHMSSVAWNTHDKIATTATMGKVSSINDKQPSLLSRRRYYWSVREDPHATEQLAASLALRPDLQSPDTLAKQLYARTGIEHTVVFYRRSKISFFSDIKTFLGL